MKRSTYLKRKARINRRDKSNSFSAAFKVCFFKSNKHYYASLVRDGDVIVSVSTQKVSEFKKPAMDRVKDIAHVFAGKISQIDMPKVIFDRGVYRFHGLVKHFVEQLRVEGIKV